MQRPILRLPPVDAYREPFVEPMGHLAMQAAKAEQLIFDLLGAVPFDGSPLQLHPGEVEQKVRQWDKSGTFINSRLGLIENEIDRESAREAVNQFIRLKDFRNRVIHDAVEVGIDFDGKAYALAIEYRRDGKNPSTVYCHPIAPHHVADLACEFYELTKDLDAIIYKIRHKSTCE